ETGVTDTTDLAQSTTTQAKRSTSLDLGASLSVKYPSVTVSASTSISLQDSSTQKREESTKHAVTLTRKASARSKQDHKVSFKVTSTTTTEDQATRKIANPYDDRTMRVDYFQRMRKWKVEMFRHDIRMTYDLVVPAPGNDLMAQLAELRQIDQEL